MSLGWRKVICSIAGVSFRLSKIVSSGIFLVSLLHLLGVCENGSTEDNA